ncbi:MAG TPA: FkbM family methyltransferase [Phormidium sp.]
MKIVKKTIRYFFSILGLEIHRVLSSQEINMIKEEARRRKLKWLIDKEIKTILDIGANTGQFAEEMDAILPGAMIYSFEPLEECYQELIEKFSDSNKFKAFNLALSNQPGTVKMRKNEYSPSSSLLPMTNLHKQCFPYTQNESIQEVSVVRLDNIADQLSLEKPFLVKIDVQGCEDKVIEGGRNTIGQASVVITEMSIDSLYEGQLLFNGIYQILMELGFQYKGSYDQLLNPHDGSVLQVDGIFMKP